MKLNTNFSELSCNPPSHEQMHQWKETLLPIHQKSKEIKTLLLSVAGGSPLALMTLLSPESKEHVAFIDYLLVFVISYSIGFLIWGWIDDFLIHRCPLDLRIDGVCYKRRAYESLRDETSFWDGAGIEDLSLSQAPKEAKRYAQNVLHDIERGFVRFDRELLSSIVTDKSNRA